MCLDDCQITFYNTDGFVQIEDKFCATETEININISVVKSKEGFSEVRKGTIFEIGWISKNRHDSKWFCRMDI